MDVSSGGGVGEKIKLAKSKVIGVRNCCDTGKNHDCELFSFVDLAGPSRFWGPVIDPVLEDIFS